MRDVIRTLVRAASDVFDLLFARPADAPHTSEALRAASAFALVVGFLVALVLSF